MADVDVEVSRSERGWVARVGGREVGALLARESRDGSAVVLVHTEVADGAEGMGVGGALVRTAVDALAVQDRAVRPDCPFAAEWLRRHPEHPVRVVHHG
ncbi:N-acetyltransferase [Phycicoccus sp. CSK15P-2]|uniref:GNAT family N-acetyltransferase n=1 Tax=Phycicoccus sp. CSK15P-2 TaxID=2807627 RepID=UPI00194FFEC0|nr:GNAT family N-acetyltransferase [Phycicoccus sp. CSK15P-2]MBM6406044.1 N-acetyltransferase [Phycicoccus sp. CSK15P-2]